MVHRVLGRIQNPTAFQVLEATQGYTCHLSFGEFVQRVHAGEDGMQLELGIDRVCDLTLGPDSAHFLGDLTQAFVDEEVASMLASCDDDEAIMRDDEERFESSGEHDFESHFFPSEQPRDLGRSAWPFN